MSVFGPLVMKHQVEAAAIETLQRWLPAYIAEAERQDGRTPGQLAPVRSWSTVNRFIQRPQDQLPAAIVISPGLSGKPEKRGGGRMAAWWRIGVAIVLTANDQQAANENASLYAAAIRLLLLHKSSLDGFAETVVWVDENDDETPPDFLEVGKVLEVVFDVLVGDVAIAGRGPTSVPDDPLADPGDWGQVQLVDIQTEAEALA